MPEMTIPFVHKGCAPDLTIWGKQKQQNGAVWLFIILFAITDNREWIRVGLVCFIAHNMNNIALVCVWCVSACFGHIEVKKENCI
jgi:hypothetical protein